MHPSETEWNVSEKTSRLRFRSCFDLAIDSSTRAITAQPWLGDLTGRLAYTATVAIARCRLTSHKLI